MTTRQRENGMVRKMRRTETTTSRCAQTPWPSSQAEHFESFPLAFLKVDDDVDDGHFLKVLALFTKYRYSSSPILFSFGSISPCSSSLPSPWLPFLWFSFDILSPFSFFFLLSSSSSCLLLSGSCRSSSSSWINSRFLTMPRCFWGSTR